MKNKTKILLFAVTLILIIGALTMAVFAANTASESSLKIKSFNLSLENAVYMNFKVSAENVSDVNDINILAWKSAPEAYVKGTEDLCLDVAYIEESTGYAVFHYDDLAAKQMTEMVYVCAYVAEGDGGVYSAPAKFSIAMYAYLKRAATNPDTDLVALMDQMLAYGAMAQSYFQYNTDFLATATLYQIDVKNGTLEDGFAKGWYQQNASFTLTADKHADGYVFSHWENSAGESVGTTPTLTLSAKQVDTYTAMYQEAITYSEGLAYTENSDGTYTVSGIGTCNDTDLRIPPTYNDKAVTSIGNYSLDGCSSLTSITIPNSVTSIDNHAFDGCSSLTSITIPDGVTSIGDYAFFGCRSLTSITIPNSVTSIDNHAFDGCSSLTSITIPDGVTSIGSSAFYECSSLTSITIPNSVTSIDSDAFFGCSSLTSITIPNSVTSIGNYAFFGCRSLTSITIPNSVTSIGDFAFSECSSLTSITIPNSVTGIGYCAFNRCSSLTSITIPNSVTSIGFSAFAYCRNLTTVYYSGTASEWGAISIGDYNYKLTSATRYYYSETQPTTTGNFWHYVDGVPTKW